MRRLEAARDPFDPPRDTYRMVPPPSVAQRAAVGPTDAALVLAARGGEPWAREALFRRYARLANGLAFRLLGRDDDVDDVVQDAYVAALRGLHRLQDPQAFASFFASIVVRTAQRCIRRRRLLSRLGLRPGPAEPDLNGLVAPSASPEVTAELRSLYGQLDRLPAALRIALVLRRVEGHAAEEVARLCGVSLATAKRRIAEGARLLQLDAPLHESSSALPSAARRSA